MVLFSIQNFCFIVVKKIITASVPDAVRGQIFALKGQGKSAYVVRKELLAQNITVSERAICALWRKKLLGILPFEGTEPGTGVVCNIEALCVTLIMA